MEKINVKNKEFLKKLPNTPGVYLFMDKTGEIVYVGRAASLKSRVSSYFKIHDIASREFQNRPIEQFAEEIKTVGIEKTSNLLEAAVLENNLIKTHWPKYNVKDKDNRSFVYLFFDMAAKFPKPIIIRGRDLGKYKPEKGKGIIVGPYQSYYVLKNILLVARRLFPYSTCLPTEALAKAGKPIKPCFHNQIGLCPGVCVGTVSEKDYKKIIKKLIKFLNSKFPKTEKKNIDDIALMPKEPILLKPTAFRAEGYDVSHFQKGDVYVSMAVFENNIPNTNEYRLFKMREAKIGDDTAALKETLERRLKHKEWPYPDLIVIDGGRAQVSTVLKVLQKNNLKIPIVGIAKAGKHSQSSTKDYILIFGGDIKKPVKDVLASQKSLFKKITAEAHRFAIKQIRKPKKLK